MDKGAEETRRVGSRYQEKRQITELENSGRVTEIYVNSGKNRRKPERKDDGLTWQEKLQQRRRMRRRRVWWALAGLSGALYVAVAVYFSFHFYRGTSIYGADCGQMTVAEAKEEVGKSFGEYKLTLQERRNVQETIRADQIDMEFVDDNSIDRMMRSQRSYIWPLMMLLGRSGTAVSFTYDREKAGKALEKLDCFNDILAIRPRDAYIEGTEDGFVVIPEEMGTTLDKEKAREAVMSALDQGKSTLSFEEENCYLNPAVYSDDAQIRQDAASMNDLASVRITYDFGDRTEVLDASVMQDWIVRLEDGTFALDDSKAELYVEALARKYDTFGMERQFYTSYQTMVSLYGGDYGWAIDQEATLRQLLEAIREKKDVTLEPVYLYTAMSREENDIGYTYVEICISQQRMICYKDGNVVADTPVVTGNPNRGNATPSGGVWSIDAKMRNYVLKGEGYQTPVDYWMPFNGDVGIHDLKARAYFGGSIYLSNGSHGCVNTPYDQVEVIYNSVEVGTPVIVYDSP